MEIAYIANFPFESWNIENIMVFIGMLNGLIFSKKKLIFIFLRILKKMKIVIFLFYQLKRN